MGMPKIECTNIDHCCAATSLIQSIALEETSISHILNAEGEKLQKAVSLSCSHKDLIEINRSVEAMVEKITNLEVVLKSKLEMVIPLVEDCHNKPENMSDCKNTEK